MVEQSAAWEKNQRKKKPIINISRNNELFHQGIAIIEERGRKGGGEEKSSIIVKRGYFGLWGNFRTLQGVPEKHTN